MSSLPECTVPLPSLPAVEDEIPDAQPVELYRHASTRSRNSTTSTLMGVSFVHSPSFPPQSLSFGDSVLAGGGAPDAPLPLYAPPTTVVNNNLPLPRTTSISYSDTHQLRNDDGALLQQEYDALISARMNNRNTDAYVLSQNPTKEPRSSTPTHNPLNPTLTFASGRVESPTPNIPADDAQAEFVAPNSYPQNSSMARRVDRNHTVPARLQISSTTMLNSASNDAPERSTSLNNGSAARNQPPNSTQHSRSASTATTPTAMYLPPLSIIPVKNVPESLCILAAPTDRTPRLKSNPIAVSIIPHPDSNTLLEGFVGLGKSKLRGIIRIVYKDESLLSSGRPRSRYVEAIKISFKVHANLFVHFGGVEEEGLSIANDYLFQKYTFAVLPTTKYAKDIPSNLIEPHRPKILLNADGIPHDFPFEFRIPADAALSPPCHAVGEIGGNTLDVRYEIKVKLTLVDQDPSGKPTYTDIRKNFILPHFPRFDRDSIAKLMASKNKVWKSTRNVEPSDIENSPPNVYTVTGEPVFDYTVSIEPLVFGAGDTLTFMFRCAPLVQSWKVKYIKLLLIEEWCTYPNVRSDDVGVSSVASGISYASVASHISTYKHSNPMSRNGYREVLDFTFTEEVNGQFWGHTTKLVRVPRNVNVDVQEHQQKVVRTLTHRIVVQIGVADKHARRLSLHSLKLTNMVKKKSKDRLHSGTVSASESLEQENDSQVPAIRRSSSVRRSISGNAPSATVKNGKSEYLLLEMPVFVCSSKEMVKDLLTVYPEVYLPPNYENRREQHADHPRTPIRNNSNESNPPPVAPPRQPENQTPEPGTSERPPSRFQRTHRLMSSGSASSALLSFGQTISGIFRSGNKVDRS